MLIVTQRFSSGEKRNIFNENDNNDDNILFLDYLNLDSVERLGMLVLVA